MTTLDPRTVHTRSDRTRRKGMAAGASVVALSAFAGAVGLIGGGIDMGAELTGRLPFASPVFGGIALATIVGVPFVVLALGAWRRSDWTDDEAFVAGSLLAGWIVVELAFIRSISFLHPLCFTVGVAFVVASRPGRLLRSVGHG